MVPALSAAHAVHTSSAAGGPPVAEASATPSLPFGAFLDDAAPGPEGAITNTVDEVTLREGDALPLAGFDGVVLRTDRTTLAPREGGMAATARPADPVATDATGKILPQPSPTQPADTAQDPVTGLARPLREALVPHTPTAPNPTTPTPGQADSTAALVTKDATASDKIPPSDQSTVRAPHPLSGAGRIPFEDQLSQSRPWASGSDGLSQGLTAAEQMAKDKAAADPQIHPRRKSDPETAVRNGPNERAANKPSGPAVATTQNGPPDKPAALPMDRGDTALRGTDPAMGLGITGGERTGVQNAAMHLPATHAPPPDVARHAAGQMAVAIGQTAGQTTEIALSPEELGRVRMTLSAIDNSVTLTVLAERPETMDLLRRHIDALAQEFRALGYADISFSFGEGRGQDDLASQADIAPVTAAEPAEDPAEDTTAIATDHHTDGQDMPIGGLDLRL